MWASDMDVESYIDWGRMAPAVPAAAPYVEGVAEVEAQIAKDGGRLIFENLPGWGKSDGKPQ